MGNSRKTQIASVHPPGSLRELTSIAVPLVLSAGSLSLMNVIDRMLLTWYSMDSLAASMPGAMMHWTALSVALGIAAYANTFVAQYEGANRPDRVCRVIWQGAYLSILAGIALMGCAPLAPQLFAWVNHAPEVQILEVQYFQILTSGSVFYLLSTVLSCFYSGRGATRVVLVVNLSSVLLNAALDYLLIFGHGGLPEWGIRGAAVATVISRGAATGWFIWLIWRESDRYPFGQQRQLDWPLIRRMIRHGLPNGLLFFADIAGFACFLFLLGGLGKVELAATNLAFTINSLAYIPMMGVGTAVMTIVGQRIGERKPELAVRTTWKALAATSAYMFAFAVFCLCWPNLVIRAFVDQSSDLDAELMYGTVSVLLRFVVVYTLFDGMAVVFSSAIRGAGDSRFCMIFTTLTCWFLMVLPTWVAIKRLDAGLYAGWWAVTIYIVVLGIGYMLRFLGGRWKRMSVIEASKPPMISDSDVTERQPNDEVSTSEDEQHAGLGISLES